jgi:DNA-binding NarL/FixJ family response regulator
MRRLPVDVVIVSANPIFCFAARELLEEGPEITRCRGIGETDVPVPPADGDPDVVLIAPRHWEEMARWLPSLRRHFYVPSWLVLADLRVSGMFASFLEMYRATILPTTATPQDLRDRVRLLVEQETTYPTTELLSHFNRNASRLPTGRPPCLLTPRELQCGCAVSLGLSNRQIAELLHLGDATVKSHVHHLLEKLELSNREDLGAYVEQALTPVAPPYRWREVQPKVWK